MSRRTPKCDSFIWEPIAKPRPVHTPGTPDLVRRNHRPIADSTCEETRTLSMKSLKQFSSVEPELPDEKKWIGGIHHQTNVKLPGYWTHERAADMRQIADSKMRERKREENAVTTEEAKQGGQANDVDEAQVASGIDDSKDWGLWNAFASWRAWFLA